MTTRLLTWAFSAGMLGALILAIGLSACGGQTDPVSAVEPTAAPAVPDTSPDVDVAPVEMSEPPAEPAAAQATTGFNISGWV